MIVDVSRTIVGQDIDICQYMMRYWGVPSSPVAAPIACCAPLVREALDPATARKVARTFKALADPARLRLLSIVAAHEDGEVCTCELTDPVGLSQPTVSHHLKVLVDAGLLHRDQRGVWAYYTVIPEALDALAAVLDTRLDALGAHRSRDRS